MSPQNPWNASNLESADATQRTTWAWAVANAARSVQQRCDAVNSSKASDYAASWKVYIAQRDARPDATNIPEPRPAVKQVVIYDASGWPEMGDDPNGTLVCQVSTYTPPVTGGSPMLQPIASSLMNILDPPAAAPLGLPQKRGDGTTWVRIG